MRKSEIFTIVSERNALRREAGLPLLDLRKEVEHLDRVERMRAWLAVCDQYADLKAAIRDRILDDYRRKGSDMQSAGGRRLLTHLVDRTFEAALARKGYPRPGGTERHPITYGGGNPSVV